MDGGKLEYLFQLSPSVRLTLEQVLLSFARTTYVYYFLMKEKLFVADGLKEALTKVLMEETNV